MTIPADLREHVRQRANFTCEYCGVAEADSAGQLTVDHFRPHAHGGTDEPDNLLYCCFRCNLYKADYWPVGARDPLLWNPRSEPAHAHLLPLSDGSLYPITPTGAFTLNRLRLNRPPLVAYRLRKLAAAEQGRLLARYRQILALLEELYQEQISLLEEHRALLEEQRTLLRLRLQRDL